MSNPSVFISWSNNNWDLFATSFKNYVPLNIWAALPLGWLALIAGGHQDADQLGIVDCGILAPCDCLPVRAWAGSHQHRLGLDV